MKKRQGLERAKLQGQYEKNLNKGAEESWVRNENKGETEEEKYKRDGKG